MPDQDGWSLTRRPLRGMTVTLTVAVLLALGCRDPSPAAIKLGFLGGISSRAADLGAAARDGALLAVEELNAAGGVAGHPLELLVRDSQGDADVAAQAVRELARAGVVAIIGPMTSTVSESVAPVAEEEGIVLLSPTASGGALSGRDDRYFHLTPPSRQLAEPLAAHTLKTLHKPLVAAIADQANRRHTESVLADFAAALERGGGELAKVVRFTSGTGQPFFPLAEQALEPAPDSVLVLANTMDAAAICQHLRARGFTGPILTTTWAVGQELLEHGGRAVDGLSFVSSFDPTHPSERFQYFSATFEHRFGRTPSFAAINGYDAIRIVASSLQPPFDRAGLERGLHRPVSFDAVQGTVRFDEFGDPIRQSIVLTVEQGGFYRQPLP